MADQLFDVRDRVVVVTGGLGQLGHQFAITLADRGARVAVLDVTAEAEAVAARYGTRADDANLLFVAGDMHEHLGQLIAYARMNRIVPPWSR